MIVFGDRDLIAGLSRSSVWLADGTFKIAPTLFYQLYSIHFESVGGYHPAGVYCVMANKTRQTYDRLLVAVKSLCPDASPSNILVDFEMAAMNAFQHAYPESDIRGCYFHLSQAVIRKVNDLGLKSDYQSNDVIRGFVRCLIALSHVPSDDVLVSYQTLVADMPNDERINDLVTYFEHTYIRGRRRPGCIEQYGNAIFPIPCWNHHQTAGDGIARTTNSVEGWHHSLQALFMCHHPTMWTFIAGLRRDCEMSKAAYLQAAAGSVNTGKKRYRDLRQRVQRAVAGYGSIDTLTFLRSIAHLSYQ